MSAYYRGEPLPEVNQYSPEPINKKTTTEATPVYKEWWFWLIIGFVVFIIVAVLVGVGIYLLVKELTKSPKYQIPANTPNVKTSLANGNNTSSTPLDGQSSYIISTGSCLKATNANAIGWKLINNSGFTLTLYIGGACPNNTTCAGTPTFWGGAIPINPNNTTKNWYDTPNNTSSGNTYYLTFYPSCSFLISLIGPVINGTTQNLPSTLNVQNQYVEITVSNNTTGTGFVSTFKVVNI